MIRVGASGTWLYDDMVLTPVRVIEIDRAFWFAHFWFDIAEADGSERG